MTKVNDQKAIRICFVSPKSYPLFNPAVKAVFGGAEVDLYLLGTELAKDKNFNISFITADYGQSATETIENVKLIKSLNFKQNPLFSAWRIWHALRKANADIYILCMHQSIDGLRALLRQYRSNPGIWPVPQSVGH